MSAASEDESGAAAAAEAKKATPKAKPKGSSTEGMKPPAAVAGSESRPQAAQGASPKQSARPRRWRLQQMPQRTLGGTIYVNK
eukprot:5407001-Pleurochrysis_carterae.AAC.1